MKIVRFIGVIFISLLISFKANESYAININDCIVDYSKPTISNDDELIGEVIVEEDSDEDNIGEVIVEEVDGEEYIYIEEEDVPLAHYKSRNPLIYYTATICVLGLLVAIIAKRNHKKIDTI